MQKKDIFKRLIIDAQEREYPSVKERDLKLPFEPSRIITIIGARRTGKTYLLFSMIKKLREKLSRKVSVYINFEDDRLFPLKINELDQLLDAYYELYPEMKEQKVYFFFDEVQNVEGWERFVRRVYDTENCYIYITGSSSKMLSKEIATSLRGRSLSYEVFPYSFREYLRIRQVDIDFHSSKKTAAIRHELMQYLETGAFPELIHMEPMERHQALEQYIDLMLYRDIIERYKISNHQLLRYLLKFLLINCGNPVSINKIYHDFRSQGWSLSKNSLYEYLGYLEEAYTLFSVLKYSNNIRERQRNPRKIYALDIGLKRAVSPTADMGRLYEMVVFQQLRRHYHPIYYWQGKQEVDFIVPEHDQSTSQLVNVCYDINDHHTNKREINGLNEAMDKLNISNSTLISGSVEKELTVGNKTITIIPLWKWLLEHSFASREIRSKK